MAAPKTDPTKAAKQPDKPVADIPPEDRLQEAAAAAEKALAAQTMANSLRETASSFTDPKKREKMLTDAYNKEIEAHGSSKKARMLQSGAFQGTVGGAGIGGAVGVGVGTVVGTVVGGLTTIPTTALGALVGSGVGVIHGPFIKLGSLAGMGGKDEKGEGKEAQGSLDDDDAVPDPEALRQAADVLAQEREKQRRNSGAPQKEGKTQRTGRKKPRKLEIRSGRQPQKT
ncbi:hypothetical protein K458DRAFT_87207 [Lentithecium fluviatile CBS 122367]|uniref:Uncharacterized protein n=1 Tax=Lentithecium fluviatile CBS 122367 TaxID=1168545 RepID=A0A6G1IRF2_9PLEO|nr:hypothetical protein K458DRAFT_87207 [Lentithecium fluviatile CBS 122367]